MLRTTTAPTIIGGGVKDNVIPAYAHAIINFRILPGDSVAGVLAHVRRSVDDPHTSVRLFGGAWEPSPVSDPAAPQFQRVQRAVSAVFPDAIVAPYLLVGATDSRHFEPLTRNVYRFGPYPVAEADLARIHGTNERVAVSGFFDGIRFYRLLMAGPAGSADARKSPIRH
jgi:carboxypeptidase PM20D1